MIAGVAAQETTWIPPRTVVVSNYIQLDAIINPWFRKLASLLFAFIVKSRMSRIVGFHNFLNSVILQHFHTLAPRSYEGLTKNYQKGHI